MTSFIKTLTSDMWENVSVVGQRVFKTIDGSNALGEAWLGSKGIGYVADWINEAHAGNSSLYAEFIAPPDRWLLIQADVIYTDSQRMIFSVYNDYTATVGAPIKILPVRSGQPGVDNKLTGSTFRTVTAPNIVATSLVSRVALFSTGRGNTGGSTGGNSFVRLLPPDSPFLLELNNDNNSSVYSQLQLRWSEIPEEYLPPVDVE